MGGGDAPAQPYVPPPKPVPKASDAAESAAQTVSDQQRFRRSYLGSFLAGPSTTTGSTNTGGKSFLG